MTKTDDLKIVCISCLTPNSAADVDCRRCRAPLRSGSSLDPLQTIRDEGALFRKAVTGRPKPIVVLGVWILFGPWLAVVIALEYFIISSGPDLVGVLFMLAGAGLFLFAAKMLYSTTKNYLRPADGVRGRSGDDQPEPEKRWRMRARKTNNPVS